MAVIAARGWPQEAAARIRSVCDDRVEVFGRSDAEQAFVRPRAAIIFAGHGYECLGGGWTLGGRSNPVFDWGGAPESIDANVLLFASCYAAGLAPDALRRMGNRGLVVHAARAWNKAYIEDASATTYEVALAALNLPDSPSFDDLTSMWRVARDGAKRRVREVGHHDWDFSTTPVAW